MSLLEDLIKMIATDVSLDPEAEITGDTDLLLTGLVDSMGVLVIVAWLEDRVGIEIDPIDIVLDNFQTVDQMVAYIEGRS